MTWIPPPEEEQNGVIRSYRIYVTELLTEIVQEILTEEDARIHVVNHLHPYYTYECKIAAFTIGLGPTASTQTTTHPAGTVHRYAYASGHQLRQNMYIIKCLLLLLLSTKRERTSRVKIRKWNIGLAQKGS